MTQGTVDAVTSGCTYLADEITTDEPLPVPDDVELIDLRTEEEKKHD